MTRGERAVCCLAASAGRGTLVVAPAGYGPYSARIDDGRTPFAAIHICGRLQLNPGYAEPQEFMQCSDTGIVLTTRTYCLASARGGRVHLLRSASTSVLAAQNGQADFSGRREYPPRRSVPVFTAASPRTTPLASVATRCPARRESPVATASTVRSNARERRSTRATPVFTATTG